MGSIHKELDKIKYEIMRQRGIVQCFRRQIKRIDGKKVIHSTREADETRLKDEFALDSWGLTDKTLLMMFLKNEETILNGLITRRNGMKHTLETRLPLTPCGLIIAIVKAKRKRKRERQRELHKYSSKYLPR